jgi:hypothetical protein
MNLEEAFNFEAARLVADEALRAKEERPLNDREVDVLRGAWHNQTYEEIAENKRFSTDYLKGDIGKKLWDRLSVALGEKVKKSNFREVLKRRSGEFTATSTSNPQSLLPNFSPDNHPLAVTELEFPDGQVPLGSAFYVERPPFESQCYDEILQPGSLIRIKAPRQMGKTSLMSRILTHAENSGYQKVRLNLRQAEEAVFSDLDKFLRWFCANVSQQLQLQPQLDTLWYAELFGSKQSCTNYFQTYLLEQIDSPIALALDEVDWVFQYPKIPEEFFSLLREWYEEAKNIDIWQRLRIVVAYSTEVYIPLNINQSPFNVGLPVELSEFSLQQVQTLARRHELDLTDRQIDQLMAMLGGHPYLIRVALYRVRRQDVTLEQLLRDAPTEAGIYGNHLLGHLLSLQKNSELREAFKKVVTTDNPVQLEPIQVPQLQRMGLVQVQGNDVTPRCNLYRQYFRDRL